MPFLIHHRKKANMKFTPFRWSLAVVVLLSLLARTPVAPAQDFTRDPFGKVIGYRVDSPHNSYSNVNLAFSDDKRALISVGGAVFDTSSQVQLGPVFRHKRQEVVRLVFLNNGLRVFAIGSKLSLWDISGDAPAPGSVLPFADGNTFADDDAQSAPNPSFKRIKLPTDLEELDCRHGLVVTPDGEHIVVCIQGKCEKRSLKTGKVVADAMVGRDVERIYTLGKDGPFLLWPKKGDQPVQSWDGNAITVDTFTEPPSPVKGRSRGGHRFSPAVSSDCKTALELVDLGDWGDCWVYVWDVAQKKVIKTVPGFKNPTAITYLADGSGYAVGYHTGRIEIRDPTHKVIEVVSPGEVVPDSTKPRNLITEMASGGSGGFKLAVYHMHGELVLYERTRKAPEQPKPTLTDFPARIGSKWLYTYTKEGSANGAMAFEIGGVEVVGTDHCLRMDRRHYNSGGGWYDQPSLLLTYRTDGLYWVGTVSKWDSDQIDFLFPPVMMLPIDRSKPDLEFASKLDGKAVKFKMRLRDETIDVPYRAMLGAVRLDRNMSGPKDATESIWFAKDIGIVRWQDVTKNTFLELKSYTPGK